VLRETADSVVVYQSRGVYGLLAILFGFLTLASAAFAATDLDRPASVSDDSVAALAIVGILGFGFVTVRIVGQVLAHRPLFRLNRSGLEWSKGRLDWESVAAVAIFTRRGRGPDQGDSRRFSLSLRQGESVRPKGTDSYDTTMFAALHAPRRTQGVVEVPVWTHEQQAREVIARLSGHAISDLPPVPS
jgi:hypothetical protein